MNLKRPTSYALHWCGSCGLLLLCWGLWLVLGLLLGLQVWIATHHELTLPDFALQAVERRLAASNVTARFGRAVFDPTGRVVLENVRLFSPLYSTPLLTIRAAYTRLNFWALLVGDLRVHEVRLTGVDLHLPAMLSPSGTDEAVVSGLDGVFHLARTRYDIDTCTFYLAGVAVTTEGSFRLPTAIHPHPGSLPLLDLVLQRYLKAGRKILALRPALDAMEQPRLHLTLTPAEGPGAVVDARFFVHAYHPEGPLLVSGGSVRARFPLLGETPFPVHARLHLRQAVWKGQGEVDGLEADLSGRLVPDRFVFSPQALRLTAAGGYVRGIPLGAPFASLTLEHLPQLRGEATLAADGAPVSVHGAVDVKKGDGAVSFRGSVTPLLHRRIAALPGLAAANQLSLGDPVHGQGDVELAGWRPVGAEGDVTTGHLVLHEVPLDAVSAHANFTGHTLRVTDLVLRQGANEARGSYTVNAVTRDYRFLLRGRLRPLDISGWFKGSWPHFWTNFDFSAAPPFADVDVVGRWRAPEQSKVFGHVDAPRVGIRGVPFDHVDTTLFFRPYYFDVFSFTAAQAGRSAHGTFVLTTEPHQPVYRTLDFKAVSDLDPMACAQIYGPAGIAMAAPYHFAAPPLVHATGHLVGPEVPGGRQTRIDATVSSTGRFTFHGFPLDDLRFTAAYNNGDLDLRQIEGRFADGKATGDAKLTGPAEPRRLAFEARLQGANLGQAIDAVESLQEQGHPAATPHPRSRLIENASRCQLDLNLHAAGHYKDFLSYQGGGHVRIQGHSLVEFPLLKLLFELLSKSLLNFKSQRLDNAEAAFTVEGPRLVFPDFKITGPSAAIEAGGEYRLDTKSLDFTARISPFREHHFVLTDVLGVALSPLLSTLEVRLTGQLADPSWSLTFLRSLAPARGPSEGAASKAAPEKSSEIQLLPTDTAPAETGVPATPSSQAPSQAKGTEEAKPPPKGNGQPRLP